MNSQRALGKFSNYTILNTTSSNDYLAVDKFSNYYILVKQTERQVLSPQIQGNSLIQPIQYLQNENSQQFVVFQFFQQSQWIGDVNAISYKSEFFCLTILYGMVEYVCNVIVKVGCSSLKYLQIENIWLQEKNILFLLHPRNSQTLFSQAQADQNIQILEKKILKKLSKILKPLFRIENHIHSQKTFLCLLMKAMFNEELTFRTFNQVMNNKKQRRKFMQKMRNAEKQTTNSHELWNVNTKTRNRRSLHQNNKVNHIDNVNKQSIDLPPSLTRKRNMLTIFHDVNTTSRSKSHSKHRYYVKANVSKNKSQSRNRYEETSNNTSIDLYRKSQQGQSVQISSIALNIREKALRKFKQENSKTIDISQLQSRSKQKDKQFRKLFDSRTQSIETTFKNPNTYYAQKNSKHQPVHNNSQNNNNNKFIISKKSSSMLRRMQQVKKQLFATIDHGCPMENSSLKLNNEQNINNHDTSLDQLNLSIDTQNNISTSFNEKMLQKEIAVERERQRGRQKQKIREKQREIQKQKQKQREKQKQRDKERQRDKEIQKQKQKERQKLKSKELQKQKEIQRQKYLQQQKEKLAQLKRKEFQLKRKQIEEQQVRIVKQKQKHSEQANQIREKQLDKNRWAQQQFQQSPIQIIRSNNQRKNQTNLNDVEEINNIPENITTISKEDFDKKKAPPLPNKNNVRKINQNFDDDQLEQIDLTSKTPRKQPPKKVNPPKQQLQKKQQMQNKNNSPTIEQNLPPSHKRMNTNQSSVASSYGPKKPVTKQVAQYLHMINKMGQAVAKSSKISSKLGEIEWFTGVYFVYKRFLYERKKIQKWLLKREYKLTRYSGQIDVAEWQKWFNSSQKQSLLEKIQSENAGIATSIIKMNSKIMKKNLPGNFLFHAALNKHSEEESKIAVSEIVREFDLLDENNMLENEDLLGHISQMLNSLYIISELDGKITERKPLLEILKKKNVDQLSKLSDYIYQTYLPENQS